jgi:hypothetical protein
VITLVPPYSVPVHHVVTPLVFYGPIYTSVRVQYVGRAENLVLYWSHIYQIVHGPHWLMLIWRNFSRSMDEDFQVL